MTPTPDTPPLGVSGLGLIRPSEPDAFPEFRRQEDF